MQSEGSTSIKAATGIDGLDDVLAGGFEREAVFLLEGNPGTGKTTIALQFLLAGAAARRARRSTSPCPRPRRNCGTAPPRTAGRSTTGSRSSSCAPPESLLDADQQQSLLYSSDLELGETTKLIFEAVERTKPEPHRARQPVGDPPAGAELAALSPADPGAEALLRPRTAPRCCCSTT